MADNTLQKILNIGLAFLKKSRAGNESVVGVDIGASSIKVVQLKERVGKAVLETYGELSLGPYVETEVGTLTNLSNEKLAQALLDALKEAEVTTSNAVLSIPSASSLIFVVDLPQTFSERELGTIIPTEARKYIPVPINEVTLDWWIIPKKIEEIEPGVEETLATGNNKRTEVLVAAIHNETIARYRDILKQAKLEVDTFEIEAWSSIRSTFGHEISAVMLMDIGASKTKLSIVDNGIIRSFHIVNRGSYDMSNGIAKAMNVPFARAEALKRESGLLGDGEQKTVSDIVRLSVDYIFGEANSVVLNYEKRYNKPITKIILSGGGALTKGLLEAATSNFRAEVVMANPFGKTETPAFLATILKSVGPEFAVSTGLALRKLKGVV